MKKRVFFAALMMGLVMALLTTGAYAADSTQDPAIQKRIENQQKRIDSGVASGQLTKQEAALVQDNLNRIKANEAKMKADGKLTPMEKTRLVQKLNRNELMIGHEKNNAIRRID
jgi:polyhydroxyalkanoate synthesis regulator phasin